MKTKVSVLGCFNQCAHLVIGYDGSGGKCTKSTRFDGVLDAATPLLEKHKSQHTKYT